MESIVNSVSGNIVDIVNRRIFSGTIHIANGKIISINETDNKFDVFIIPGFVDAHVHIESSLMPPSHFAYAALKCGMLAAVTDPHEIANVCGIAGIKFMYDDAQRVPFYFKIGAPSCVPATNIESSGAILSSNEIEILFSSGICSHLSEVMNFPGVINSDPQVLAKLKLAKDYGYVIDGHAPFVRGNALKKYFEAGITSDHECTTIEEAIEKLSLGMKILIREGSAAKNLDTLKVLIPEYYNKLMLCTDDIHAENILNGYFLPSVKRLISDGFSVFDVLKVASLNACRHYDIPLGQLQVGDNADFILIDSLTEFNIQEVFFQGRHVLHSEISKSEFVLNNFSAQLTEIDDFKIESKTEYIKCIKVIDKEIITESVVLLAHIVNNFAVADVDRDILKIAVLNRYKPSKPAIGFVTGYGLKLGAIAASISHDSHNIICIGASDLDMQNAVNNIINTKGGICYFNNNEIVKLDLPIAGLMSDAGIENIAMLYSTIEDLLKKNGCVLSSPLMNLSFLSLLVIPHLKISDRGLFDFSTFTYTDIFV